MDNFSANYNRSSAWCIAYMKWMCPKKFFFARDTAALLLDCAVAHSVELA